MSRDPPERDPREVAEEAAEWVLVLESGSREERAGLVDWLKKSPEHVEALLRMLELDAALSALLPRTSSASGGLRRDAVRRYLTSSEATSRGHAYALPEELETYRRATIQVLLHRSIDRDSAEDLFQELWLQVLEDSRIESFSDSHQLIRYLYRAACDRVTAFRHGELSWVGGHRPSMTGLWQSEEPTALEESLGPRRLAQCARELLFRAPVVPDRKVLEAYFVHPDPNRSARRGVSLTPFELGQVFWRVRQQFGEIVRERGGALNDPEREHAKEVLQAAMYVANVLASGEEERSFELQMMWNPRCAAEVDVWRALKRGMVHVDRRREAAACG